MEKQAKSKKKSCRSSETTKKLILNALETLIERDGFTTVGVNAVAREAGVDKVLLYRYFNSMEGLLKAFAEKSSFWPNLQHLYESMPENLSNAEVISRIVIAFYRAVQSNPLAQELLRWELSETNPLTSSFFKNRVKSELDVFAKKGILPKEDLVIFVSILISGLQFLALRGKESFAFLGLNYSENEILERVEKVVSTAIGGYVAFTEAVSAGAL